MPLINSNTVPGQNVKVPIQRNDYDCGLFMLENVEYLAKCGGNMPMPPIKGTLSSCYEAKDVEKNKRTQLREYIRALEEEQTPAKPKGVPPEHVQLLD